MKQKLITFVLTIVAVFTPLLVVPIEGVFNYNIGKITVLLISGLLLLLLLLTSYKTLTLDKKDIVILIFFVLVIISTFLSINIRKAILGEKHRYEGLLTFGTYICIYLCSKKYFKYEKISKFLNIMFYVSMAIGILGIAQKYISYKPLYPLFNKGICSTLGNSNFFGSFISIVLPAALAIFILKGNKRSFILSLILFFNMIASGTRSAWVAFLVIGLIGVIYLIKERNKKYFIRGGIIITCFIIICAYLFGAFGFMSKTIVNEDIKTTNDPAQKIEQVKKDIERLTEKNGNPKKIGSNRLWIWYMSYKVMIQTPMFGCGPDNLKDGILIYSLEELLGYAEIEHKVIDKAHNEFLHIGATIGVPALICYLIFIASIILPKTKLILKNHIYFVMWMILISYLVQAFFNISTIGIAPLFWMMLGLIDNKELIKKLDEMQ